MVKEILGCECKQRIQSGVVLVDFFSSTCGPCKMLSFVLADIDAQLQNKIQILKIDFDKNQELVEQYNVNGYPTLLLFKDGVEINRMRGLQQKPAILAMINDSIN